MTPPQPLGVGDDSDDKLNYFGFVFVVALVAKVAGMPPPVTVVTLFAIVGFLGVEIFRGRPKSQDAGLDALVLGGLFNTLV